MSRMSYRLKDPTDILHVIYSKCILSRFLCIRCKIATELYNVRPSCLEIRHLFLSLTILLENFKLVHLHLSHFCISIEFPLFCWMWCLLKVHYLYVKLNSNFPTKLSLYTSCILYVYQQIYSTLCSSTFLKCSNLLDK